jgi:hypothetical protein
MVLIYVVSLEDEGVELFGKLWLLVRYQSGNPADAHASAFVMRTNLLWLAGASNVVSVAVDRQAHLSS